MSAVAAQRHADAGFFEDWSAWASLDGHPPRPLPAWPRGEAAPERSPTGGWAKAWIVPDARAGVYHVRVGCASAVEIVARLPGAACVRRDRYDTRRTHWRVPASGWAELRAAAPRLAALCAAHRRASGG